MNNILIRSKKIIFMIFAIGAVVGEWIGGSTGLGSFMIYSNARLQTDNMFAALLILIFMTITIYKITDYVLSKYVWWK